MKQFTPQQLNKVWKILDHCVTRKQRYNAIMWAFKLPLHKYDHGFLYKMICSEDYNNKHKNDK